MRLRPEGDGTTGPAGTTGKCRASSGWPQAAPSVSGFVQHAVAVALDDVAGWGAMLAQALRETGGTPSEDERAWADDILGTSPRPGRPAA